MPSPIISLYWGGRNQIQPPLKFSYPLIFKVLLKSYWLLTLWYNFSEFKSEQPIESYFNNLTVVNLYMFVTMDL